ncbi:hypothetical protein K491DRAFT_71940 [Lophiostoma macrostomum CBS 122681]|uniref:Uncharacterized protein n=1 Tax=Lophiostoma macrostomum CBS 122681 TaxID=1314788 RepID=A0A6A6SWC0_9PLEO|nr:hypothetical protein K491DRAFT_71940 [Lophiostoma macrostomum CBS 122681]
MQVFCILCSSPVILVSRYSGEARGARAENEKTNTAVILTTQQGDTRDATFQKLLPSFSDRRHADRMRFELRQAFFQLHRKRDVPLPHRPQRRPSALLPTDMHGIIAPLVSL